MNDGLAALRVAQRAAFVLYCIALGTIFLATLLSLLSTFFSGRLSAFVDILISSLAFLSLGIASAVATAVAVKAADAVNEHGAQVGVSARKGAKFLVLTWVATGLCFLMMCVWGVECVVGHRRRRNKMVHEYDGAEMK